MRLALLGLLIAPVLAAQSAGVAPSSAAAQSERVCRDLVLAPGRGVLVGRAIDSANERAIDGAQVVVSWSDLVVDKTTLQVERVQRAAIIRTDSNGEYRACGVPTATRLTIQLQYGERTSTAIGVMVSEKERIAEQHLSLPSASTATLAGVVRGAGGLPIPNVELRVRDAIGTATTDSAGRFLLRGLPDGTQLLIARRIGYALAEIPVELRSGQRLVRDVRLERAVELAPIVISEYRTRFKEFEFNRHLHLMADFLTADMIARRNPEEVGDAVDLIPGFMVIGHGGVAKVFTNKAYQQGTGCPANVVVDGVQEMGVNDVRPEEVVGIEAYIVPPKPSFYRPGFCGLVVIWTTNWRRPTRVEAVTTLPQP